MQLLVVHREAEMGGQLVQMVRDYTTHRCDLVFSDTAALEWAHGHPQCALLLTQLTDEGVDGLALGGSLSEVFPRLQVWFFPQYPASDRQLEICPTKVFPEPIDGDALLSAIELAGNSCDCPQDLFHLVDLVQMCCLGRRTGALQIVKEKRSGLIFMRDGQLLHAETKAASGMDALLEMAEWEDVEFAYNGSVLPGIESIAMSWGDALIDAWTVCKSSDPLPTAERERA